MNEETKNKLAELVESIAPEDLVFFKTVVNKTIDARLQQLSINNIIKKEKKEGKNEGKSERKRSEDLVFFKTVANKDH
jgi:hypothetical protein